MNAGYVYVMAFDNGIVKVGRTQNIARRLITHAQSAHNFGIAVTGKWVSPLHGGWINNEDELIRIAHELGGKPTTPEHFRGVSFEALRERARQLPFTSGVTPSRRPPLDAEAILRARIGKFLTQQEVAEQCAPRCAELGIKFDRSSLSMIENGRVKRPALRIIPVLAEVLGMDPDEMFKAEDPEDSGVEEDEAA